MKRKSSIFKHIATMLFAVGTVAAPLAAHADTNFVVDGNFTNLTPGDYQPYFAGQTFGGDFGNAWLVTGNVQVIGAGVDVINTYWSAPLPGQGSVDLNGNAPGGISQNLNLLAGAYQLSFNYSGNPDAQGVKTMDVSVNGTPLVPGGLTYPVTSANSGTNMLWTSAKLNFTTTGNGSTTLAFTSTSPNGAYGMALGNISVIRVPEVSAKGSLAALMAVAALGLMAGERRRRVS